MTSLPTTGRDEPRSITGLLGDLDRVDPKSAARLQPFKTGFDPLDVLLEGGLYGHDLTLLGGPPGVGKTVMALQWARRIAQQGRTAVYVCYEHDEATLLSRLLLLEMGELARPQDAGELQGLRLAAREYATGSRSLDQLLGEGLLIRAAHDRLNSYADRLWLVKAHGARTGLAELAAFLSGHNGNPVALFVDYLQKVAVNAYEGDARIARVTEGLKELALDTGAAVVAVVAADHSGLTSRRLRLHHLRGDASLAYEADVILMANEKQQAVSRVHLTYDISRAEGFKQWVVLTVEKNRGGLAPIDVEFRKDFVNYRFDPCGRHVKERLVDDVVVVE